MKFSDLDTPRTPGAPLESVSEGPPLRTRLGGTGVQLSQSTLVKGASAGVAAYAVVKFGLADKLPSVDGLGKGIVLVALGFALAALVRPGGVLDDVAEGAGFGLVAVGALHIGS